MVAGGSGGSRSTVRARNLDALVIAAAVSLGIAGPASAGDVAELGCPAEALDAGETATMVAALTGSRGDVVPARRAGARVIASCGGRFDWNEDERDAANGFLAASLMQAHYQAMLVARGIDAAWLEGEVVRDDGLVAAAAAMRDSPPELDAFIARVRGGLGEQHGRDPILQERVGAFIFAVAYSEAARRRFARA